jgi:PKD repeat protein
MKTYALNLIVLLLPLCSINGQERIDFGKLRDESQGELFVSGNLFDAEDNFNQVVIFQIDKQSGFLRESIDILYGYDVRNAYGDLDFTVAPVSHGFDDAVGPGLFFVSSWSGGGGEVMLHRITGTIGSSPSLEVNSILMPSYSLSGNGLQLGTSDFMNTNDCRFQSGFYADETIHFVLNTERQGGYTGIYYGADFDNGYENVLSNWIGKIVSGGVQQQSPVADFSADTTAIAEGQSVSFTDLSANDPTDWSWSFPGGTPSSSTLPNPSIIYEEAGTYGVALTVSNAAGSDTEEKSGYISVFPDLEPPVADFSADDSSIEEGQQVTFTDLSANAPTSWAWSFPGGTPSTSTAANPTVTYDSVGVFNVSLTVANEGGSDTEEKSGYISVFPGLEPPVADFSASQTTVAEGQPVTFTDLSANSPTSWAWSFPGGQPESSTDQHPSVTFAVEGTYNVSLEAANSSGSDLIVKDGYITVVPELLAPVADFVADTTSVGLGGKVRFTDLSANNPNFWLWVFPGGTPASSQLQHPEVQYNAPGLYDVTLVASNPAGNATATKTAYILVDTETSSREERALLSSFKVFPNPSAAGERISAQFTLHRALELDCYLLDQGGRVVKYLLHHRAKQGRNLLSFRSGLLPSGTYYLSLQDNKNNVLKAAKLVVE